MTSSVLAKYILKISNIINERENQLKIYFEDDIISCYRGEKEDFKKTACMPSWYRNDYKEKTAEHYHELLIDYDIPEVTSKNKLSQAIDGQHYISLSKLLDVSFSILPALYFASERTADEVCNEKDGMMYLFTFPESYSPNSSYLIDFYEDHVINKHPLYDKDFKVITHNYNNQRIVNQSGGFVLFPGNKFHKIPEYYINNIPIKAEDKDDLREGLELLFGLTEATLFPEKDKRRKVFEDNLKRLKRSDISSNKNLIDITHFMARLENEINIQYSKGFSKHKIKRTIRKQIRDLEGFVKSNYGGDIMEEKLNFIYTQQERFKTKLHILS